MTPQLHLAFSTWEKFAFVISQKHSSKKSHTLVINLRANHKSENLLPLCENMLQLGGVLFYYLLPVQPFLKKNKMDRRLVEVEDVLEPLVERLTPREPAERRGAASSTPVPARL